MNAPRFINLFVISTLIASAPFFSAAAELDPLNDADMLEILRQRKIEQRRVANNSKIAADLSFADKFDSSGIAFTNSIVEDALKYFKPAHYDHGAGISIADVNGDGLLDIYFVNQIGGSELWRNLGGGRFENSTRASGLALPEKIAVAAAFGDIDNDGDSDLFVTTVRTGNVLFENTGKGVFRDITSSAGVEYSGHSSGAVFFDVNNDGLLDLFVANVGIYTSDERGLGGYYRAMPDAFAGHTKDGRDEPSLLYINQGHRRFKESHREMGLVENAWSGDASFADINHDGFADLYILNMQGDDAFFINEKGRRFSERTQEYFPKTAWGAMGLKFFDFNQDGQLDLYVTDMHSDMTGLQTKLSKSKADFRFESAKSERWCTAEYSDAYLKNGANNFFGNAFYRASESGRFEEVSDEIGAETFWPWGLSVADINADGYPDAFITAGMGFGFRYGINSLLLNDAGQRFVPAELITGIEPRADGVLRKTGFVLDCSGADKDHPLCQGRTGRVPVSEALSSRSSAVFDWDNDGDLDILVNEMDHRPQLLESSLASSRKLSWLKIRLRGTKSNRDGLGARVEVKAGGKTWFQQHDGKSGYLSQSSMPLYFGLAGAARVESIEIAWPSGAKQTVTDQAPNQLISITEPR